MASDILIVDDEADIRIQISGILEDEGFETRQAANSSEALAEVATRQPSLVILDVWLKNSKYDGLQILEIIKRDHPNLQVIMISGHGTFDMAVSATKMGAYDFITKPFKTDVLLHTINRAIGEVKLRRENNQLKERVGGGLEEKLIGSSSFMQDTIKALEKVAPTESRVLITGVPGSGKSLAARLIHNQSTRREGPFVILNCASLSPDRFEEALFGVETSDESPRKVGLLEEAHGGTLLLDEVSDTPMETQGKIVRVLHNQRFQRVGGTGWVEVNVRVIAASNRDLGKLIEENLFREDLFYRLNVVPLTMPHLNQRREDIPELSEYFMKRSSTAKGRPVMRFSDDAMLTLQGYDWPGNVWELVNVIERLLLLPTGTSDEHINASDVTNAIGSVGRDTSGFDPSGNVMNQPLREARESFEREYLLFHLTRNGGNISRTAEFVGMDRAALHRKLKGLGVQSVIKAQR